MVSSIRNNKHKMRYFSEKKLLKKGFKYNEVTETYCYSFPVYKCNNVALLFGKIIATKEGHITLEVVDKNGDLYQPFYYCEYGNFDVMLNIINGMFIGKFKQLDIVRKGYDYGKKTRHNVNNALS